MITDVTKLDYRKQRGKWKYVLTSPLVSLFDCPWAKTGKTYQFWMMRGTRDQLLGTLYADGAFVMEKDYASDGATFAPDFVSIMREVFFHDIMCQFAQVMNSPFSRRDADETFLVGMKNREFFLREVYFRGVRIGAAFQSPPLNDLFITIS